MGRAVGRGSTYAAVAENAAVVLLGGANLSASDTGTGKRGAQQVAVFVDGVACGPEVR